MNPPKVIYELTEADLEKVIDAKLGQLAERAVLGRFSGRMVSADTVADIYGVHKDTIIRHAKAMHLPHEHSGKLWKFPLDKILALDLADIKKRIRTF